MNNEIKTAGQIIIEAKRAEKANPSPPAPLKWTDKPAYESAADIRAETGYSAPQQASRPNLPWAKQVLGNQEKRDERESPLKEWWLENGWKKEN